MAEIDREGGSAMRYYDTSGGKLSPEDAEHLVQAAVADQRLEGLHMADAEIDKLRDLANGRITKQEYDTWVRERVMA